MAALPCVDCGRPETLWHVTGLVTATVTREGHHSITEFAALGQGQAAITRACLRCQHVPSFPLSASSLQLARP